MLSRMTAAIIGIAGTTLLPALPPLAVLWLLLPLSLLLLFSSPAVNKTVGCLLAGAAWGLWYGHRLMASLLPLAMEGHWLVVQGVITGLPTTYLSQRGTVQRFELALSQPICLAPDSTDNTACFSRANKLRLSAYDHPVTLKPGQHWRMTVKLKRPHGHLNPGGFDYQAWQLQHGLSATGNLNPRVEPLLLAQQHTVDYWRWQLVEHLDTVLADARQAPVLKALMVGDQRGISRADWQLYADSGVTHLMVISGLHIGLVATLAYGLVSMAGRMLGLGYPERFASLAALAAALAYALMAGFSLPTQRALIMTGVVALAVLRHRQLTPGLCFLLAVLLCLLDNPLVLFGRSFWLSFGAVAIILYTLAGRRPRERGLKGLVLLQWRLFVGLFPLMVFQLGQVSLVSPVVNLLLVPLFSLLVVPGNFLGLAVNLLDAELAQTVWLAMDRLVDGAHWLMAQLLAVLPEPVMTMPGLSPLVMLLALAGIVMAALPRGLPCRYIALLALLPLFMPAGKKLAKGEVELTVLDVGQGLSVAVHTRSRTLLYDLGKVGNGEFSTVSTVVLPYLQWRGIDKIDALVISHGDSDHRGDWRTLLDRVSVGTTYFGQPIEGLGGQTCRVGAGWHWDGVHFEFLYPAGETVAETLSANNQSCLLKISAGKSVFLLPGDIESSVEKALVTEAPALLRADVLIAPHHGSTTSSSWPFLKAVQPQTVVFSSGYRNSFGHPSPAVTARYRALGVVQYRTDRHGAITLQGKIPEKPTASSYRKDYRRYWR